MENRFEISMLLDHYGSLLTEKQLNIMNLYYNEDLSLAEIAEINDTSRQAIYDLTKRCYKQLSTYESKLKLLARSNNRSDMKDMLVKKLKDEFNLDKEVVNHIEINIEDIINA